MNFSKILRIVFPIALLGIGVVVAGQLSKRTPKAERKKPNASVLLVELKALQPQTATATIESTGVASAANEVMLIPEVSGRAVFVSKSLVPGGRVKKGQVLIRIDARDYRLAFEQQQGAVRSAKLEVELEEQRKKLAEYEWSVLDVEGDAPPTVSRESQQAAAEENLRSRKSSLERARLNLGRTTIVAPFDATVVSENVDRGQVVGPQSQLAHLVGTARLRVMVSVPVDDLELVRIPGIGLSSDGKPNEQGSQAVVKHQLKSGRAITRAGTVSRLIEKLDERTRRAQLVVTVEDPLDPTVGLPLMAGAPVEVTIRGRDYKGMFPVPRSAVYDGNVVWVSNDSKLERRELNVVWGDQQLLYVNRGLVAGEQLVLTRLASPLVGMKVRAANPEEPTAAANQPPEKNPQGEKVRVKKELAQ